MRRQHIPRVGCRSVRRFVPALLLIALAAGCAEPTNTRLAASDFDEFATEFSGQFLSDFEGSPLADCSEQTPPMCIAIHKVVNLSSDLMSEGEKWYLASRVQSAFARRSFQRCRGRFVVPVEHMEEAKKVGEVEADAFSERAPTHVLGLTLRSATRIAGKDRTEGYQCGYQLTDLTSGEAILSGNVLIKRAARGRLYD